MKCSYTLAYKKVHDGRNDEYRLESEDTQTWAIPLPLSMVAKEVEQQLETIMRNDRIQGSVIITIEAGE